MRGTYAEHEVDLFAVYCGELDRCFLLPSVVGAGKTELHLRLTPARNGQQALYYPCRQTSISPGL